MKFIEKYRNLISERNYIKETIASAISRFGRYML